MYGELPEIETTDGQKTTGYPVQILNPPKTAVLRLPTSAELLTYLSSQRSRYHDLGRGIGEGEDVPNPKADQTLFRAIRIDKVIATDPATQDFDDAEAARAIGLVTRHKVVSCERDGQNYVVTLMTPFGETTHTVSIPFERDQAEYRRNVYKARDLPNGVEERRFPPEVPVKLYDKIIVEFAGYVISDAGLVPPHHKRSVINSVMSALAALDPALDPN